MMSRRKLAAAQITNVPRPSAAEKRTLLAEFLSSERGAQAELARRIEWDTGSVNDWVHGRREVPDGAYYGMLLLQGRLVWAEGVVQLLPRAAGTSESPGGTAMSEPLATASRQLSHLWDSVQAGRINPVAWEAVVTLLDKWVPPARRALAEPGE